MQIQQLEAKLKEMLPSEIFAHSVKVKDYCYILAKHHKCDADKLAIAGLLHNCGKVFSSDEMIYKAEDLDIPITEVILSSPIDTLHSIIGANLIRDKFGIEDTEILTAVNHHNFGANEMTLFTKLLFIANKVYSIDHKYIDEINKIKEIVLDDIDKAVIMTFDLMLKNYIDEGMLINSQIVSSRNKILMTLKHENNLSKSVIF